MMGWKPPTQKAFDAGEIPHKKSMSDEEAARMEANRPNRDVEAMLGGNPMRQMMITEDIPEVQMEKLEALLPLGDNLAISDWLNELKEEEEFGILEGVLDNSFESTIISKLGSTGKPFMAADVFKIAYLKELRPHMFFFGMGYIDNDIELQVVVTPAKSFVESSQYDLFNLADYVVPDFLTATRSSIYVFDQNMTGSQVRKLMVTLGFNERHEIAG